MAYPAIEDVTLNNISKDCFMDGLPNATQVELRRRPDFIKFNVTNLAEELLRLELAGVLPETGQVRAVREGGAYLDTKDEADD